MSTPVTELLPDLESQKANLLSSYIHQDDDVGKEPAGIYVTRKELAQAHKPISTLTIDGVVKQSRGPSQTSFLIWTVINNTLATIGIVFANKEIFNDPSFHSVQTSFATFHFICTSLTLYVMSRPPLAFFVPIRCSFVDILPLAFAMCFNVILPNISLAYSSVIFYQTVRILLTPFVAFINLTFYGIAMPRPATLSLIPVCVGVAIVLYYNIRGPQGLDSNVTGVIFAFTGVVASSLYTVWIGTYHRKLNMSSMQLLFNQAPTSSVLLLFFIPLTDTIPAFADVPVSRWVVIGVSGVLASLINLSQFFVIAGGGAVSSTVVGHAKTCSIVVLGWAYSGSSISSRSLLGIFLAIGGIMLYSSATFKAQR